MCEKDKRGYFALGRDFALAFFIDKISLVGALHSWFGLSNTIVIKHSKKEYLEILKTLHRMWCLG